MRLYFIITRLWRYLGLYFLKPFDAINDTLTASLLSTLNWEGRILEVGSGDGVFSYIMHGGKFPLWLDRYLVTDLDKSDIYDTHKNYLFKGFKRLEAPNIILAIDVKESHLQKIMEIGFVTSALQAEYEKLPIRESSLEKIFYYIPHGLKNYSDALGEARTALAKNAKLLALLYDSAFKNSFLCYFISQKSKSRSVRNYFAKLDNGRFQELTSLAKAEEEWRDFFQAEGFKIIRKLTGLSTFAWKFYDIQTRPILKYSIKFFNFFPLVIRTVLKFIWMIAWFPFLVFFYILFSNEFIKIDKKNCYFAFELEKVR